MNEEIIKRKILKKKTAKLGITGNSVCVRIPLRDLEASGMVLGETVKLTSRSGKITISKLLPKEKKMLGV